MPAPQLFIAVDYNQTYACAGFAHVRLEAPPTGAAGGWRRTTAWRAAIDGLAAGLAGAPGPVVVVTANTRVANLVVALRAGAAPEGLDAAEAKAWAGLVKVVAGRSLGYAPAKTEPGSAAAFCAAWAELARDRAKDRGEFTAAIPKPNLAKLTA